MNTTKRRNETRVCHRRKASGQVALIRIGERTTKRLDHFNEAWMFICGFGWCRVPIKKSKAVFGSRGTSPATRTAFIKMDGWV